MKIACIKEQHANENRVAIIPDIIAPLTKLGFEVLIEAGAGEKSFFSDEAYRSSGARVEKDLSLCIQEADVVAVIGAPIHEQLINRIREGSILVGMLNLFENVTFLTELIHSKITAFSLEFVPRISRAQSMDVLSSQASVAGYKAALIAAQHLGKYFPMLTTAAGTIIPAKVFVLGAGVAGLQAIATSRRLGAVVEAFDIRPAAKDEVESIGAKFVHTELEENTATEQGYAKEISEDAKIREQELLATHIAKSDVVITTAQVPGKKAPSIITEKMVEAMRAGSVIVDIAAGQGGNCVLTEADKEIMHHGVKILGPVNLPSSMPVHASQMYARNVLKFLQNMVKDGKIQLSFDDEIIDQACVTHHGEIRNKTLKEVVAN